MAAQDGSRTAGSYLPMPLIGTDLSIDGEGGRIDRKGETRRTAMRLGKAAINLVSPPRLEIKAGISGHQLSRTAERRMPVRENEKARRSRAGL